MAGEQIVRALAAANPKTYIGAGLAYPQCALCAAPAPTEVKRHAADCPWRMAVEYTQRYPTPDDSKLERLGEENVRLRAAIYEHRERTEAITHPSQAAYIDASLWAAVDVTPAPQSLDNA